MKGITNKEIKTKNGILIIIAATLIILGGILLTNIDLIFGAGTGDADTLDSMDWEGDDCSGVDCNIKDYIDAKSAPCADDAAGECYITQATKSILDTDLATSNIKSGTTIFGIAGNSNVVDTSAGTVAANSQILNGYMAYSDGTQYTGSISNCASQGSQSCYATGAYYAGTTQTVSNAATAQSAGYYNAFNLATVDTDLAAGNIKSGVNIFGVAGSLTTSIKCRAGTDSRCWSDYCTIGTECGAMCVTADNKYWFSIKTGFINGVMYVTPTCFVSGAYYSCSGGFGYGVVQCVAF